MTTSTERGLDYSTLVDNTPNGNTKTTPKGVVFFCTNNSVDPDGPGQKSNCDAVELFLEGPGKITGENCITHLTFFNKKNLVFSY